MRGGLRRPVPRGAEKGLASADTLQVRALRVLLRAHCGNDQGNGAADEVLAMEHGVEGGTDLGLVMVHSAGGQTGASKRTPISIS